MSYSQSPGKAALAYPDRGLAVLPSHWPTPTDLPQFCSCGNLQCPNPGCHPIGNLSVTDATRDLSQLSRWWLAHPTANLATFTDESRIGVIELEHPGKPEYVMRLLNVRCTEHGPVIHAGQRRLQFLVTPDQPHPDDTRSVASDCGKVTYLPPATLLLLPPSRLMTGEVVRYIRRLQHLTRLPEAAPLLDQLTDLVETGSLNERHPLLTT
jgi:hypothetical protein